MLSSELDYDLPPELIAQEPASPRDHSRLMHLRRTSGEIAHHRFYELPQLLRPDDLLVFNDTRVLRARLRGFKVSDEAGAVYRGARVEVLLLRERDPNRWEAMLKPSARLRPGTRLHLVSPDEALQVEAHVVERTSSGWIVQFLGSDIRHALPLLGEVPLPPYISTPLHDENRYQTIYARDKRESDKRESDKRSDAEQAGSLESAAAPTAGLHFTPQLLDVLQARGIRTAFVTLAIGIGTFRPIKSETLEEHAMHEEEFEISTSTAQLIHEQKQRGGRIVAVGTTTTRVLESASDEAGGVQAGAGRTSIFIRPGYRFRTVDALLTNFHLPRSTLLAMIAAFAENGDAEIFGQDRAATSETSTTVGTTLSGLQRIRYAYKQAIAEHYRFFSFGDAMLID
ncbi:MAG TPA: tRNA preQ1(34) S-adenosylmethionine ribosyltransferase-isomerase QueA [Abditibacteriaceae bacterium]